MGIYAVLDNSSPQTIVNVIVADQDFIDEVYPGAVEIDTVPGSPGIGWQTSDGGTTWTPPAS